VFAGCGLYGYELVFDGPLSVMPANYLAWHVADVLARVLRCARGGAEENLNRAWDEALRRHRPEKIIKLFVRKERGPVREILHTWGLPTERPALPPK
jgi:hypothetical protein